MTSSKGLPLVHLCQYYLGILPFLLPLYPHFTLWNVINRLKSPLFEHSFLVLPSNLGNGNVTTCARILVGLAKTYPTLSVIEVTLGANGQ